MRAPMLVPCAFAVALAGCKGMKREVPPPMETTLDAAPAPATPPPGGRSVGASEPFESFFEPGSDGGAGAIVREDAPNMRYAKLGRDACLAELGRREIAFQAVPKTPWTRKPRIARLEKAKKSVDAAKHAKAPKVVKAPKATPVTPLGADDGTSVLAPVRLGGPLHGIAIHSALPEKVRAMSTVEIFDCRLVLALDDFTSVLAKHEIVEAIHMSAFRSQRDRGCTPSYPGKQHCGALAVDMGTFRKKDGSVLDVEKDWHGRVGTATCTPGTGPSPLTPSATELWDIVCESARRGLFHVVLTPNFNAEHKNHLHLEITPDVAWMLIK